MEMSHFVFDLTCDVTGDTGVNFSTSSDRSRPGLSIVVWIFTVTSIGYRDRWGGGGGATARQHKAGVGLGPAGRGLTA